jgi:hypothetical protein
MLSAFSEKAETLQKHCFFIYLKIEARIIDFNIGMGMGDTGHPETSYTNTGYLPFATHSK